MPRLAVPDSVRLKNWSKDVAFRAQIVGSDGKAVSGLGISYATHVANVGWTSAVIDGAVSGGTTTGNQIEAIRMNLTGDQKDSYDLYYRVHVQNYGWMNWARNGADAGTTGYAYRVEAIQVQLVAKDAAAPTATPANNTTKSFSQAVIVYAMVHGQNYGWTQGWMAGNQMTSSTAGTTGQGLRLEAIRLRDNNANIVLHYQAHVQDKGWLAAVDEGQDAGTTGQSLRMEALKIWKTGDDAAKVTYQYRVHIQNKGWTDWITVGSDKDTAVTGGSTGQSLRLEAIEFRTAD